MATLKSKKVGSVKHDLSGVEIDFFLTGTKFTARVLEEEVSASEANVLKRTILDRLDHWCNLEWFPIIGVDVRSGFDDDEESSELKLSVNRYFLSRSPAGEVKKVAWEVDPIHRKANMRRMTSRDVALSKLPLEAPLHVNDTEFLMDYDGAAWNSLLSITAGIRHLRKEIEKLVKTRAGINRLITTGSKLLLPEKSEQGV